MTRPQTLLQELVAIPSVSSMSNRPVVEWIQRFIEPLGWHHRLFCYDDAAGVEKVNLVVSPQPMGDGRIEAELAIVCHTDTVPFGAEWREATELRERDGMLHGCGACDVKGFLACMLAAASSVSAREMSKRFCLVFTADEEVGCRGARFLLEADAIRARYAIVGEPTSLTPARAGKGYCLASIKVIGRAAHSAFPEAGRSAIFAAARLLREIEALALELMVERNDAFSPPWTTLNVGEIRGGTAKNVVPAECSFLLEWRPISTQRPEVVLERLREVVRRLSSEESWEGFEVQIEALRMEGGFETRIDSAVIQAVLKETDSKIQTISFGTEAPWLARMGAEAVVIGPGSMLTAHSPRECVPSGELDECVAILRRAIEELCS
ncbi:acetylornithine deacetylase [Tunturiibacter gelidoferens]|uniref:Acetylornithine deacetylase n=2 Tax=Tunturiibacter TaxID=3154218 RepID=A0A7Y9NQE5_9BACT|nr:acetylornithine deacetylase [Edaphobacter lichenicola]MBB5341609.1 acetylornithine deacetylase [Edaphobacter lichenicola]NYF53417.1 acetylornithine deacetylase [Edaphobacter lichenicola]